MVRALAALIATFTVAAAAAPFALITETSGSISVIDAETLEVVGRMTPGGAPYGVAARAGSNRAYVANFSRDAIHVVDIAARAIVSSISVAGNPTAVAVNPAGTRLFVVHDLPPPAPPNSQGVTVINTENAGSITTIPVGQGASRIAMDPLGTRVFVSNTASGSVSVIDAQANTFLHHIPTPPAPLGMAVDLPGQRLFVAHSTGSTVSVIDIASRQVVGTVGVGSRPDSVAVHPSAPRLYVSNRGGDSVSVVNSDTLAMLYTMPVGTGPEGLDVTPDGAFVHVANGGSASVSVFHALQPVQFRTVPVGAAPFAAGRFFGGSAQLAPQVPDILSGLWWNPAESGWGIHLTHRRNTVFAAWFTYDPFGFPRWMVASNCSMSPPLACPTCVAGALCSGDLYEASGPRFFSDPFDPRFVHVNRVGLLQIEFRDENRARMSYVLGSRRRVLDISRQVWATGATPPAVNYTDLWWNPQESGWGLGITQQFGVMFLTWFVYEDTGRPAWYVASDCAVKASGNGCRGTLYETRGPSGPVVSDTFDASRVTVAPVGEIDVTFTDSNNGVITYTVHRRPGSKTITRQLF